MAARSFVGWLPCHLSRGAWTADGSPALRWCWLGARRLEEPFLEQTLEELFRASPWSLLLRRTTSLDEWAAHPDAARALTPAGFIFHVSRCGSTLVSRSLAALPDVRVVSEPRPVADLLARPDLDDARRARWLRALVAAYGQSGVPGERRLVVKFDSVDSLDLAFVRRVFPGVPWVFVYRDPVEVLVSNLDSGSAALAPGGLDGRRLGFDGALPPRAHAAAVLARYYAAGLEAAGAPGGRLLHYDELPGAIPTTVAAHFGLAPSADDARRMETVAGVYAKEPGEPIPFQADGADKQRRASAAVRALVEEHLRPVYQLLESRRLGAPSR